MIFEFGSRIPWDKMLPSMLCKFRFSAGIDPSETSRLYKNSLGVDAGVGASNNLPSLTVSSK